MEQNNSSENNFKNPQELYNYIITEQQKVINSQNEMIKNQENTIKIQEDNIKKQEFVIKEKNEILQIKNEVIKEALEDKTLKRKRDTSENVNDVKVNNVNNVKLTKRIKRTMNTEDHLDISAWNFATFSSYDKTFVLRDPNLIFAEKLKKCGIHDKSIYVSEHRLNKLDEIFRKLKIKNLNVNISTTRQYMCAKIDTNTTKLFLNLYTVHNLLKTRKIINGYNDHFRIIMKRLDKVIRKRTLVIVSIAENESITSFTNDKIFKSNLESYFHKNTRFIVDPVYTYTTNDYYNVWVRKFEIIP